MNNSRIVFELHRGFKPYVTKKKLDDYEMEVFSKNQFRAKFVIEFFSKYVNIEKYSKKPKKAHDAMLFNYFLIEIPNLGLKATPLFLEYLKEEENFQPKKTKS